MLGGIFGPSTAKTQSLHIFECGLIRHPRVETANDDVKIAIWPPEGTDELPSDAAICIHWTKTPTRLRRCGYLTIPIAEMKDAWWEDKDWKVCHRIAGRIRERHAHRKFHRNPEDARNAPDPM